MSHSSYFPSGRWIWSRETRPNHFVLFTRSLPCLPGEIIRLRVSASYNYDLWINGLFLGRGPVHGDNHWCHFDEYTYVVAPGQQSLDIAALVHHSTGTLLGYQLPGAAGFLAEITSPSVTAGTDSNWKYQDLEMWRADTGQRGWALDYLEDYDARLEPPGWLDKHWFEAGTASWPNAVEVADADTLWSNYSPRRQPPLRHDFLPPHEFWSYQASVQGTQKIEDVCRFSDEEPLVPVEEPAPFTTDQLNENLWEANAYTFDLGKEWVGHYYLDIEAPEGLTIEISGAELLRDGRPWIFRKGTNYSARFITRAGRQHLQPFFWTGCRYLHLVIRGSLEGVKIHQVGLLRRQPPLAWKGSIKTPDRELQEILEMCRHTVEVGTQEHLIDCPTREQTQYWGDGLFVAKTLWLGWGERSYLDYFLDSYLHVPLLEDGQISAKYPGAGQPLLDYSLIPVLGQLFYKAQTGNYYRPAETLEKALTVKNWYDERLNEAGLVDFNFQEYFDRGVINFIDHCGIGWHNFPHRGIDRDGTSCPLNLFLYGHLKVLAELASHLPDPRAAALQTQASHLGEAIQSTFWDGRLYHDAEKDGSLSEGTSWQANCLAVYFDLVTGETATSLMREMLARYDEVCRCSPYFHYYFLPALRKAGLETEAIELIKREWSPMMTAGATTAWEGFLGDEKDSLCHPWSTAPLLFLLES